jgi:hypothetical protein
MNSPHLLKEIMAAGKGVTDKFVESALRRDVAGSFRGVKVEVVPIFRTTGLDRKSS